jgi:hypothetical protein
MHVNKVLKRVGITALVLVTVAVCMHFFIRHRARQILNYVVTEASNGQYKLDSKKVKFKYFPLSVAATGLSFYPTDSLSGNTYYTATANNALVELSGIWSLITNKRFHLRKVSISQPQINAFNRDTIRGAQISFNLRLQEMQDALLKSLSEFNVDECKISDAGIYYQQNIPGGQPLSINHITLNIDSLRAVKHAEGDSNFGFKANVRLFINKPFIQLPDTSMKAEIGTLLLDTKKEEFAVNQFALYDHKNGSTTGSINLSEIRIRKFNWLRWLKEGVVEIDSLKASNGFTFFDFSDRQLFALNSKQGDRKIIKVNVPIVVHAVEINKIQYGLRSLSANGPFTVQLDGDSLGISNLSFTQNPTRPVQIGNLAFKVTNYTNNTDNEQNESRFDKLVIHHNDLEFQNFSRTFGSSKATTKNSITIPSLKLIDFSLDDLLQYKLNADKLILERPSLEIDIHKSQKKQSLDEEVARISTSLQSSLQIRLINIRDAAITLNPKESPTNKITIEKLSTEIDAKQLLASKSVMDIIGSATALTTSAFHVSGSKINLEVEKSVLNNERNGIDVQRLTGTIGSQVEIDLHGISLLDKSHRFDITKIQTIELDNISIQSGKINIKLPEKKATNTAIAPTPSFILHSVNAGNINFNIAKQNNSFLINNIALNGKGITIKDAEAKWDSLNFKTGVAAWLGNTADVHVSSITKKHTGVLQLNNIQIQPHQIGALSLLNVPNAFIYGRLDGSGNSDISINKITLENPLLQLDLDKEDKGAANPQLLPTFHLKELLINNPHIVVSKKKGGIDYRLLTDSGQILLKNLATKPADNLVELGWLHLQLNSPNFIIADSNKYAPKHLKLQASHTTFNTQNKVLESIIDTAQIVDIPFHLEKKFTTEITGASMGIAEFRYSSKDSFSLPLLLNHGNWWANATAIKQEAKQHNISIYNPYISSNKSLIQFDSLTMLPKQQREVFWEKQIVEKDYLTLKMGSTSIHNWQLNEMGEKGVRPYNFSVEKVVADSVLFWVERDKTKKSDTGLYKPLLAKSLEKLPILFSADTVQISNSFVRHNVIPEKSKTEASIFFTDMNGTILNIKNKNFSTADSLRFRVRSKLMGQSDLSVAFRQAYKDSLQGFWLRARMGKMDMTSLNQLLVPLLSVKIERGNADTMLLLAQGNDYVAYGTMDLRYKNLRVSLLRKGEDQYFLAKVYNWLINIVVREEDHAGKSILFQERFRNRSIYNYWAKIAINGLLANLGIKKDKNQLRKYRRFIKENKLPDYSGDQWQGR